NSRGAAPPGNRPTVAVPQRTLAVPQGTADHIVTVAQERDCWGVAGRIVAAHPIIGDGANEAVGLRDDALASHRAIAPGNRPAVGVPDRAVDQVVAVLQGDDGSAYPIIVVAADEAVGLGDDAAEFGRGAEPGRRPTVALPPRAEDHVVAVAQ